MPQPAQWWFGAAYVPAAIRDPVQAALFNCVPLPVTLAPTIHPGAPPRSPPPSQAPVATVGATQSPSGVLLAAKTSGAAAWSPGLGADEPRGGVRRLWANGRLGAALIASMLTLGMLACP